MEYSVYFEIIIAAAVLFLALIVSVAIPPRHGRKVLGSIAVMTAFIALGMYGYGHSFLFLNGSKNHTIVTSVLRTVFDASRIFVGSNNWSDIHVAYEGAWKGWEVLF